MKKIIFLIASLILSTYSWANLPKPIAEHVTSIERTNGNHKLVSRDVDTENFVTLVDDAYTDGKYQAIESLRSSLYPMYSLPDGYYYLGLPKENILFSEYLSYAIAPAYGGEAKWKNKSVGAASYEWLFPYPDSDDQPGEEFFLTTDEEPAYVYPFGTFWAPELRAINGSEAIIYRWGEKINITTKGVIAYGGKLRKQHPTEDVLMEYGATNVDHVNYGGSKISKIDANNFLFGTNNLSINSFGEAFSKPAHPYILEEIKIGMGQFQAPAGLEFNLTIYKMVDGQITDEVLATAVTRTENVYSTGPAAHTMIFEEFKVKVGSLTLTKSEIIIQDEILVVLSGYNQKDVSLSVADQASPSLDGKATSYIYIKLTAGGYAWRKVEDRVIETINGISVPKRTSIDMTLGIVYSFLYSNDANFKAPAAGGKKTFVTSSFFLPSYNDEDGELVEILEFENVPEWITQSYKFDEGTRKTLISFTTAVLPEGVNERTEVITATIPGASCMFTINQSVSNNNDDVDEGTGIAQNKYTDLKVVTTPTSLDLSYTESYKSLAIYTISGQLMATYLLPQTGEYSLSTQNMGKGIYLLKIDGNQKATIKVVL